MAKQTANKYAIARPIDVEADFGRSLPHRSGKGRTVVNYRKVSVNGSVLEASFERTNGSVVEQGTMTMMYNVHNPDDEIAKAVNALMAVVDEAFQRNRK